MYNHADHKISQKGASRFKEKTRVQSSKKQSDDRNGKRSKETHYRKKQKGSGSSFAENVPSDRQGGQTRNYQEKYRRSQKIQTRKNDQKNREIIKTPENRGFLLYRFNVI